MKKINLLIIALISILTLPRTINAKEIETFTETRYFKVVESAKYPITKEISQSEYTLKSAMAGNDSTIYTNYYAVTLTAGKTGFDFDSGGMYFQLNTQIKVEWSQTPLYSSYDLFGIRCDSKCEETYKLLRIPVEDNNYIVANLLTSAYTTTAYGTVYGINTAAYDGGIKSGRIYQLDQEFKAYNVSTVYGTYLHANNTISEQNALDCTVGAGGYGNVVEFFNTAAQSTYDKDISLSVSV